MDSLQGFTLHQLMEQKKNFAPEHAVDITIHLLQSLSAAHKSGKFYGAIYPDQVLVFDNKVQLLELAAPREPEDVTLPYLSFIPPEILESEYGARPEPTPEADLYSAGIILYTLLAGHSPFSGQDRDKVLESIFQIRMDPLPEIKGNLNQITWIIRKCLLRIPTRRFRTADEMLAELQEIRPTRSHKTAPPAPFPGKKPVARKTEFDPRAIWEEHRNIVIAAGAGILVLLVVVILLSGHKSPTRSVVHGQPKALPQEWTNEQSPTLSPDAAQIAYVSDLSGNQELYIRDMNSRKGIALTSSPGKETDPRWSPLGDTILYTYMEPLQPPVLFAVATSGGIPQKIAAGGEQGSWSPDGKKICFVVVSDATRGLAVVDIDTFQIKTILENEKSIANPVFSPDGEKIVYDADVDGGHGLVSVKIDSGKKETLTTGPQDSMPVWDWAADAIYYCSRQSNHSEIWSLDHRGNKTQITENDNDFRPDIAAKKPVLAFYRQEVLNDIFSFDPEKRTGKNVSPFPGSSSYPLSVASGRWLAFLQQQNGNLRLNWVSWSNLATSNVVPQIPAGSSFSVSPDGNSLYWETASGLQQLVLTTGKSVSMGQNLLLPYISSPDHKSLFYAKKNGNQVDYILKDSKSQQEEVVFQLPVAGRVTRAAWTPQSKSIVFVSADHRLTLFSVSDRSSTVLLQPCFDFSLKPRSSVAAILAGPDLQHAQLSLYEIDKGKQTALTSFDPDNYAVHLDWSQAGDVLYYDRRKPGSELVLIK